ncbi:YnhF family membrane protein [Vibrio breoganii]|uniref:YnhF family membrane protein n=1 Tax=Vibrio breoganii TaxID=553239 RepID=A0ABX1U5N2_9VIBR|nr:YnhF family membrane protein [Vibrio breoganii]NMR69047.1 YnhF family membrane protein [Vibrio breoganii]TKF88647.1 YnhF family membrane protein [Vibrio breoganii]TKG23354.1 YnhF family membrane protein [Vibrio breoganii]TKG23561.1 YnhF family membrane protein [Vibrio breoganii]
MSTDLKFTITIVTSIFAILIAYGLVAVFS